MTKHIIVLVGIVLDVCSGTMFEQCWKALLEGSRRNNRFKGNPAAGMRLTVSLHFLASGVSRRFQLPFISWPLGLAVGSNCPSFLGLWG